MLGLLYVALFSQWIGFFAWNAGMAMGGIARVSQVQLLQPFVTFALAAFFNDETITLQIVLFAAAVVATVAISTRTPRAEGDRADASPAIGSGLSFRSSGGQPFPELHDAAATGSSTAYSVVVAIRQVPDLLDAQSRAVSRARSPAPHR